ncbi:MAG: hypothetical protein H6720_16340, partial [Sandaracinus sp.]|nr:hypothetical protein [Sandaracinus sp.]
MRLLPFLLVCAACASSSVKDPIDAFFPSDRSDNDGGPSEPRDPLAGTEAEGSPLCGERIECCLGGLPVALPESAVTTTVTGLETTDGITHVSFEDSSSVSLGAVPDLAIGNTVQREPSALGLVIRDTEGVVVVVGSGSFEEGEIAIGDTTLSPVLVCHGWATHQGFSYGCQDVLLADYAMRLGSTEVGAGQTADVAVGDATYRVRT